MTPAPPRPPGPSGKEERDSVRRQQYRDILEEGDRMRAALIAFEAWAEAVIAMLADSEAADFGRDRVAQSQAARTITIPPPPRKQGPLMPPRPEQPRAEQQPAAPTQPRTAAGRALHRDYDVPSHLILAIEAEAAAAPAPLPETYTTAGKPHNGPPLRGFVGSTMSGHWKRGAAAAAPLDVDLLAKALEIAGRLPTLDHDFYSGWKKRAIQIRDVYARLSQSSETPHDR